MLNNISAIDLAGPVPCRPNCCQMLTRINRLVDQSLSLEKLNERLQDLPVQLERPQARPWHPLVWEAIHSGQIIGVKTAVLLAVLRGTMDTEAPIRGYTQTSRQYLESVNRLLGWHRTLTPESLQPYFGPQLPDSGIANALTPAVHLKSPVAP